jgi:hypothetical protein
VSPWRTNHVIAVITTWAHLAVKGVGKALSNIHTSLLHLCSNLPVALGDPLLVLAVHKLSSEADDTGYVFASSWPSIISASELKQGRVHPSTSVAA